MPLKLYYTGVQESQAPQTNPLLSLGGYFSSRPVPNDTFSNLFGEISKLTLERNSPEYIGIAMKNETGGDVTDIMIGYEYDELAQATWEVAAVMPAIDDCSDPFMERIPSRFSRPLTGTFVEANKAHAFAEIELTQGANAGDEVEIYADGGLLATTVPFAQTVGVEFVVDAIVAAMVGDPTYLVEKKIVNKVIVQSVENNGVVSNERVVVPMFFVVFTRYDFTSATNLIELQINSIDIAPPQNLAGGVDNTQNLGPLLADQYLAIWFKRSLNDRALEIAKGEGDASCEELYANFGNEDQILPTVESVDITIEWT